MRERMKYSCRYLVVLCFFRMTSSRAWEILESNLGRANPDVGAACISLGNLAIIRHRPVEATDWFRRALQTLEVGQDENIPATTP